jgi:hypothetical protein
MCQINAAAFAEFILISYRLISRAGRATAFFIVARHPSSYTSPVGWGSFRPPATYELTNSRGFAFQKA